MDLDHPFGRGGGCVAVAVRSPPYLRRVITNLEKILWTQFAWQRDHQDFQPHLTISRSSSAQRSVAGCCISRTYRRGGPLTGRATGLELWEHRNGRKSCVKVFKFSNGGNENAVVRQETRYVSQETLYARRETLYARRESRARPTSSIGMCGLLVLPITVICRLVVFTITGIYRLLALAITAI
ncbi:hypothetical protein FIBSPDRAFT_940802, partial [Athelia psychrophila]